MALDRDVIILTFVFGYMALNIAVGLWAMGRTHSAADFFVAGRDLGPLVVSLAVFSSTLSGFGFVGGPGLVYATGLSSLWMVICSTLGYATGFYLVAKRIRMIAEVRDTLSLSDVLAARYRSETVRLVTGVTILLGVLAYLATQILAMALVLQSILGALPAFEGVGLITCAVLSLAVLVFYSVTGGIIASVYTDVFQGIIMMVAGLLVVFAAMNSFEGGFTEASRIILADDPEAILPFGTFGSMVSLAWFFLFGFGLAGQPHIITKMMMNRRLADNRVIMPMSVVSYAFSALLWVSVGVAMHALVISGAHPPLASADEAAPAFLSVYASPWLAGLVFAGLFAAIMSTADAFLNIGAAAVVHDIPRSIMGRSLRQELFWARTATVGISLLAMGFALYSHFLGGRLVAILGAFGWGTFAAALLPVVAIGLNWKQASRQAAIASMVLSLGLNLAIELFSLRMPFGMNGSFVSLLVSLSVFIGWSLIDRRETLARDIDRIMDL
ncbi:MAG: sodium/proline symporter [Alphaproteobacteria bacterium]